MSLEFKTIINVLKKTRGKINKGIIMFLSIMSRDGVTINGFGMVNGFTGNLQIVTSGNYSAIINSHTLQFITEHNKSSQSAVSSPVVAW
jgi:hypothetical protein